MVSKLRLLGTDRPVLVVISGCPERDARLDRFGECPVSRGQGVLVVLPQIPLASATFAKI